MLDNTDLETVQWWHEFLGNPYQIHHIRRQDPHRDIYRSTTTSDTLGKRLMELGAMPRKSYRNDPFPEVPEDMLPHFMRGFFDGDGGIGLHSNAKMKSGKNLVVGLTSNPHQFREGLAKILGSLGTRPVLNRITLTLSGSDAERFCLWIYKEDGPAMARKKDIWGEWCALRAGHGGLICQSDPYESLRGLRPQTWHRLVGTMPDRKVAEIAGVSSKNVHRVRSILGLPPIREEKGIAPRIWHSLAGTMTDAEVAREGGVSKSMVCMYRKKVGIPSFRSQQNEVVR